jgi:hypothetical protein
MVGSLSTGPLGRGPASQLLATPQTAIMAIPSKDHLSGTCENTSQPASVANAI